MSSLNTSVLYKRFTLSLIGILISCSSVHSQSPWQHIGPNDGLAQGYVGAMLQDSRGFLWFGTKDGLSRYDGYTFKNYRPDPGDSASITSDLVSALHECTTGMIWVGFFKGTIDIFDRATETFTHLRYNAGIDPEGVRLWSIAEDTSGVHWIGTTQGVFRIEHLASAPLHPLRAAEPGSPVITNLETTFADRSGGLWIWNNGKVNVHNRHLSRLPEFNSTSSSLVLSHGGMFENPSGNIMFFMRDDLRQYCYSFEPATGTTFRLPFPETHLVHVVAGSNRSETIYAIGEESIVRMDLSNPAKQEIIERPNRFNPASAILDSSGILWIGLSGHGIDRYNPATGRFGAIPGANFFQMLRQAMEKTGFPRLDGNGNTAFADLYDCVVFRDPRGREWYPWIPVWYDTDNWSNTPGVICYDPATRTTKTFRRAQLGELLTPATFPTSYQVKLLPGTNGTIWFAGSLVLSAYDSSHGFRHYRIVDGELQPREKTTHQELEPFNITAALRDREGIFWLCVLPQGLFRFNPATLELERFSYEPGDQASLGNNNVLCIAEDPVDPDRFLWIGTDGGGLNKFDKSTGRSARFTTREGLPSNVIYTVFPDKKGNLWMSTNNGLCVMNPRTLSFKYYDIHDGLQGMEFNRERNYQTPDGRIYLEGTAGMNVFYPEDITENSHIPPIVFTDLRIHGKSVSLEDKRSPLIKSIVETQEIVLPFDQNILTIAFAALDFANPGSNEYAYRLEGFSDEWTKPSNEHTATFTNLSPGTYTLRVRGSNNDGVWNNAGASLTLTILPPWYRTWWAYVGYGGLAIIALFSFRRYDLKRIRLKDQLELAEVKTLQLKEVDQLKMQFFQNISHEFRTPLTLILGPLEKMLGGPDIEDGQKRELRMMRRNAQRLLRLINQILDLSKLEAGKMKLRASRGDLVAFVKGMVMSFHSLAERKDILLDVRTDVGQLEIWFDREKLERIIINLLSNAFKFTPDHGEIVVSITVASFPSPQGGGVSRSDGARISVRDTGIGIQPEKIARIFDRFYQVDSSTTRAREGTGIGLALVRDLVNLHHGSITVTSEAGKGSEFVVGLPIGKSHLKPEEILENTATDAVAKPSTVADEEPDQEYAQAPGSTDNADKPLLLIIEDNSDVRAYLKSYLVPTYTVLEATDGAEGVEKAKEIIPDLVISDVMMPEMDGYGVCARLKRDEKTSHVPIILLTAKAAKEDKIDGLEAGADDYLIKPFDSTELLVRVKNLIESRRKLREKFGKELVSLKPGEVLVDSSEQSFITKITKAVEINLGSERFGVEDLAGACGLTVRQLQRKLKGLANVTPNEFIRSFRLHRAKDLLQNDNSSISEIAYSVGFGSPAYFTKCFQEEFGTTPSVARKP